LTDPEAVQRFEDLYGRHYRRVYAYAVSKAGRQLADEVTSEVFLIAWRRLASVPEYPLPWLLAVARNVITGQFRTAARQRSVAAEMRAWVKEQPASPDVADEVSERIWVLTALAALPEADRELLTLAAWHSLSARAAAQVVGCSTATSSSACTGPGTGWSGRWRIRQPRANPGWRRPGTLNAAVTWQLPARTVRQRRPRPFQGTPAYPDSRRY